METWNGNLEMEEEIEEKIKGKDWEEKTGG
jgi:hypothetical protein